MGRWSWPAVSPPRIRLGWIHITSVQNAHLTVPFAATSVLLDRPQFLQFQFRRTGSITLAFSPKAGDGQRVTKRASRRRGFGEKTVYHREKPLPQARGLIYIIY